MGRRKIEIRAITNERNRSVTFLKRKNGLFKKAYELATLCSVDVALVVFEHRPGREVKLHQYSSKDVLSIFSRVSSWKGIREIKYPSGSKPPEGEDSDDEGDGSDIDEPAKDKPDGSSPSQDLPSLDDSSLFKMDDQDIESPPREEGGSPSLRDIRGLKIAHSTRVHPYPSPTLSNPDDSVSVRSDHAYKRPKLESSSFRDEQARRHTNEHRSASIPADNGLIPPSLHGLPFPFSVPPSMIPYLQAAAAAHAQDTQMQRLYHQPPPAQFPHGSSYRTPPSGPLYSSHQTATHSIATSSDLYATQGGIPCPPRVNLADPLSFIPPDFSVHSGGTPPSFPVNGSPSLSSTGSSVDVPNSHPPFTQQSFFHGLEWPTGNVNSLDAPSHQTPNPSRLGGNLSWLDMLGHKSALGDRSSPTPSESISSKRKWDLDVP